MTRPTLRRGPHPLDVVREQTRAVALALRVPALVAAAVLAAVSVGIVIEVGNGGEAMAFVPERSMLPGMAGLFLPVGVWAGEQRFGAGFLRTLPVDHRWHALARVAAGWLCLMAAIATFVLWMLAIVLLTGGSPFATETAHVLASPSFPGPGALDVPPYPGIVDPASLRPVRLEPQPLLWLAPFTGATATYLLASAVAVGLRHPLRWIAGSLVALALAAGLADLVGRAADSQGLIFAPSRALQSFLFGPFGLDTLLTGRTESLRTTVAFAGGERLTLWRGLPDLGQWATATLLWTIAGLLLLWLAASRHRERRRV